MWVKSVNVETKGHFLRNLNFGFNDVETETPTEEVPEEPAQTEEQESTEVTDDVAATDDTNIVEQTEEEPSVEPEQPAKPCKFFFK